MIARLSPLTTRRQFVKTAAGAAALAAAGGRPVDAAGRGMFLSMRTLNGFWEPGAAPWNPEWRAFVDVAARAGYGGVDLLPFASMAEDGPDAVRSRLAELDLEVGFLGCPVNPGTSDDAAFRSGLERLEQVSAFAAAIGYPRLVTALLSSSDAPKDEWRKVVLDRMRAMSPTLERHGVRVAIENLAPLHFRKRLAHEFLYTVPDIVALCAEAGAAWGLCLDAWHWHHSGGTVKDILDAGKSQVVVVHLEDSKDLPPEAVEDSRRLMPGEGVIDLDGFLGALRQIGYEGHVSPEPLGRFPAGTPADEVARLSLEASVASMRRAGIELRERAA